MQRRREFRRIRAGGGVRHSAPGDDLGVEREGLTYGYGMGTMGEGSVEGGGGDGGGAAGRGKMKIRGPLSCIIIYSSV